MTASSRDLAALYDTQLRLFAAGFDLRNNGRYRSAYRLDEFFFELVGLCAPALFIEAGAFEADASRRVKRRCPAARVVAFEANPYNYAHFTSTIDYAAEGVEYVERALTDEPGTVTFHLAREHGGRDVGQVAGSHSLKQRDVDILGQPLTGATEEVSVEGVTLDGFFPEVTGPVAMWVDVEGASREVLTGGPGVLRQCAVLKIEVEERQWWRDQWLSLEVIEHLVEAGLVPIARDVPGVGQFNLVCVGGDFAHSEAFRSAHERYAREAVRPELPGLIGRVRRSERVRSAARAARAARTALAKVTDSSRRSDAP